MRQFPPGPCDTLPSMRQFTQRPCDTLPSMRHFSRRSCDSLLSMRHFTHGAKVRENGPVRAARGPGRVVRWGDQWQCGIRPHDPTSGPHRVDTSIGAGHFHLNSLVPEAGPGATRSGSLKHGIFFHCRGSFPARPSQSAAKPGPCRSPKRGSGRSGRSKRAKPSAGTPRKLSHGAAQRRGNCRMVRPSAPRKLSHGCSSPPSLVLSSVARHASAQSPRPRRRRAPIQPSTRDGIKTMRQYSELRYSHR